MVCDRRSDASVQLYKCMIKQILWMHVINMCMHVVYSRQRKGERNTDVMSVCVCVHSLQASGSPGVGSWAER